LIFHLQSAKGLEKPTRQRLLDGRVQVISRSGLNPCEVMLIQALPSWQPLGAGSTPRVLTIGNRSGVLGQAACEVFGAQTTAHQFDIHHQRNMQSQVLATFRQRLSAICSSDLPADEDYDLVLFQLNRGNLTTELIHDLVQQASQRLRPGGRMAFAIQGNAQWLIRRLQDSYRRVQIQSQRRDLSLIVAGEGKPVDKIRQFAATVPVTLPNNIAFSLVTYPGVFAHRRVDAGGLALAETMDVLPGDRVLDLGCGSGLIGIAAAKLAPLERLTLIDSHARAIQAARENLHSHSLDALGEVLHSDGSPQDLLPLHEQFTMFVGNPPYYSQNQVTRRFVQIAFQTLRAGGRAWFVTKNPEWLGREIERDFGEVQYFTRRQYTLLRSVKP